MTSSDLPDKDWIVDDSQWSHKAFMSDRDADLFETILLRKAPASGVLNVLEWGSGRSTVYLTNMLLKEVKQFFWNSLEYDREYFLSSLEPVFAESAQFSKSEEDGRIIFASQNVRIDVFDYGKLSPFLREHADDRQVPMDDYIGLPARLGGRFDVVLVDGRKRRRCTLEAKELLKPGGVVVVHDAYRPYYHCAFETYTAQQFIGDILWIGSKEKTDFSDLLEQAG
ncbi:MAG: hypothetical protein KIT08_06100 [Anaerolineales bacterium]|nr:MAG: hypothetical protein KIT08_06100 [Anaerolineales bacterium]